MDCLFCKIVAGEIPSTKIYEDDYVYAFADIDPKAPFHAIIIPREHIKSANDINQTNSHLVAKVFEAAAKIAKAENLSIDKAEVDEQVEAAYSGKTYTDADWQSVYDSMLQQEVVAFLESVWKE